MNSKLDLYSKKALEMDIPATVVACVKSAVDSIPRKKEGKENSCVDETTFDLVMGKSLPRCMTDEAVGADAKRANGVLGAKLKEKGLKIGAPVTRIISAELQEADTHRQVGSSEQTSRKPSHVDGSLGQITARWDCDIYQCFCRCDSGCHYCCTLKGSGMPGTPQHACLSSLGCPPDSNGEYSSNCPEEV